MRFIYIAATEEFQPAAPSPIVDDSDYTVPMAQPPIGNVVVDPSSWPDETMNFSVIPPMIDEDNGYYPWRQRPLVNLQSDFFDESWPSPPAPLVDEEGFRPMKQQLVLKNRYFSQDFWQPDVLLGTAPPSALANNHLYLHIGLGIGIR